MQTGDILIYQTKDGQTSIEVKVEGDTVWLTQAQMAELFQQTKQNISLHINNIYKENELDKNSTVKESLTVRKEGNRSVKIWTYGEMEKGSFTGWIRADRSRSANLLFPSPPR